MTEENPSFEKETLSGRPPENPDGTAPADIDPKTGQHKDHWVLPEAERAKGYIRPVRTQYRHTTCGQVTRMPDGIAQTYARNPFYYGSTFCATCKDYLPVGQNGEFHWLDDGTKVGT